MGTHDYLIGYASFSQSRFWHARKRDSNHSEITAALRDHGAAVLTLDAVRSKGYPDVLIGFMGFNILAEIEIPGGKLLAQQEEWHQAWKGSVHVIHTVEEAIALLKQCEQAVASKK